MPTVKKSEFEKNSDLIKKRLNVQLVESEITPEQLAKRLNVNRTTVSTWIGKSGNVNKMSLKRLRDVCRVLDVSPAEILSDIKI